MFEIFKKRVQEQFKVLTESTNVLFLTDVDKELLWETYLNSFPEGTNNVYKTRREYECNHCKQFIRNYGNVVAIINGELVSIWKVANENLEPEFVAVAKAMDTLVTSRPVKCLFVSVFSKLGIDYNIVLNPDDTTTKWHHFSFNLPSSHVFVTKDSPEAVIGKFQSKKEVMKRAFDEITLDAIETVLDLINQNSIYRGAEFKGLIENFLAEYNAYHNYPGNKDNYCWLRTYSISESIAHIRNSSIGTLLVSLSEGTELNQAVASFEKIVAPTNYKRPSPVISKRQIEAAEKTIVELNLLDSLERRYAINSDVSVNNVIYVDRNVKATMKNAFEALKESVPVSGKILEKVSQVTIDEFINNILPSTNSLELLFESKLVNNLVSLIAPVHNNANLLFKWRNNFSWSYNNNVTDSIKEAVKARGGNVSGVLRFSINWAEDQLTDNSDLDAHARITGPKGSGHIYYSDKTNYHYKGNLDVDITRPNHLNNKNVVENIIFTDIDAIRSTFINFSVFGFAVRGEQKGFSAEIEFGGQIFKFNCGKPMRTNDSVSVATIEVDKNGVITLRKELDYTPVSVNHWGINTEQFHKVNMLMYSPNYWDEQQGIGNKHYMFMLQNCVNPNPSRGFYNEFLKEDLNVHRKVFEALGHKMMVQPSEQQLSGLGFSSTRDDIVTAKIAGKINRIINIKF